jgi:hypothetical protein
MQGQAKTFRIKDVENAAKADREFENTMKLRNRASTFPLRANPTESGALGSPRAKLRGPSNSDTSTVADDESPDHPGKVVRDPAVSTAATRGCVHSTCCHCLRGQAIFVECPFDACGYGSTHSITIACMHPTTHAWPCRGTMTCQCCSPRHTASCCEKRCWRMRSGSILSEWRPAPAPSCNVVTETGRQELAAALLKEPARPRASTRAVQPAKLHCPSAALSGRDLQRALRLHTNPWGGGAPGRSLPQVQAGCGAEGAC